MLSCCWPTMPQQRQLSHKDKLFILNSWLNFRNGKREEDIGMEAALEMYSIYPEIKDIFTIYRDARMKHLTDKEMIRTHSQQVASVVDKCVMRMDDAHAFAMIAVDEGSVHIKIQERFMRCYVDCYIREIKKYSKLKWSRANQMAWEVFFDTIVVNMKNGWDHRTSVIALPPGPTRPKKKGIGSFTKKSRSKTNH